MTVRLWLLLLTAGLVSSMPSSSGLGIQRPTLSLSQRTPDGLRDGDIVFRRGRDLVSGIVLARTPGARFSHVGVVIIRDSSVHVVHAVPEQEGAPGGVIIEPLESFVSPDRATDTAFFRVSGLSWVEAQVVAKYVENQIGKPFDARLAYSTDDALYCSELVLKALRWAGTDHGGSLQRVGVLTMQEPAVPPDSLLAIDGLREIARMGHGLDGADSRQVLAGR